MREALIFAAGIAIGAAIGSFCTYKYLQKPRRIIKEDSETEILETIDPKDIFKSKEEEEQFKNSSMAKYMNTVKENGYSEPKESTDDGNDPIGPVVINPDNLGDEFGQENTEDLFWSSDDVLLDSSYNEIIDPELTGLLGDIDIPSNMGKYEPDTMAIRHYGRKKDYLIYGCARTAEELKYTHG